MSEVRLDVGHDRREGRWLLRRLLNFCRFFTLACDPSLGSRPVRVVLAYAQSRLCIEHDSGGGSGVVRPDGEGIVGQTHQYIISSVILQHQTSQSRRALELWQSADAQRPMLMR